jgi:hypothetical protein
MYQHLFCVEKKNNYKNHKIKRLFSLGLEPIVIKVKDNLDEQIAFTIEIELINLIGRVNLKTGPLTNICDGGGKIGPLFGEYNSFYGKVRTPEHKAAMLEGMLKAFKDKSHVEKRSKKRLDTLKKLNKLDSLKTFSGKKHSQETKEKIGKKTSQTQKGELNSQYGTCWVTNGKENKKIKREKLEFWLTKQDWVLGRKINVESNAL